MNIAAQLKQGISRQFSTGSLRLSRKFSFKRQNSHDPRRNNLCFSFGRQSSLDPIRRSPGEDDLTVPENLDSTMQLLFLACRGDADGVQGLLEASKLTDMRPANLESHTRSLLMLSPLPYTIGVPCNVQEDGLMNVT